MALLLNFFFSLKISARVDSVKSSLYNDSCSVIRECVCLWCGCTFLARSVCILRLTHSGIRIRLLNLHNSNCTISYSFSLSNKVTPVSCATCNRTCCTPFAIDKLYCAYCTVCCVKFLIPVTLGLGLIELSWHSLAPTIN